MNQRGAGARASSWPGAAARAPGPRAGPPHLASTRFGRQLQLDTASLSPTRRWRAEQPCGGWAPRRTSLRGSCSSVPMRLTRAGMRPASCANCTSSCGNVSAGTAAGPGAPPGAAHSSGVYHPRLHYQHAHPHSMHMHEHGSMQPQSSPVPSCMSLSASARHGSPLQAGPRIGPARTGGSVAPTVSDEKRFIDRFCVQRHRASSPCLACIITSGALPLLG